MNIIVVERHKVEEENKVVDIINDNIIVRNGVSTEKAELRKLGSDIP